MERNIKEMLKTKSKIPRRWENEIREKGKITGSKAFGGFSSGNSDIDYLLPPTISFGFDDVMREGVGIYGANSGNDIAFTIRGIYVNMNFTRHPVNLLFTKSMSTFLDWSKTTNLMRQLQMTGISEYMKDKQFRVSLFEMIKDRVMEK